MAAPIPSEAGKDRPVRLRLSRAKRFDLQAHSLATNGLPAVAVARPTKWGNPYPAIEDIRRPAAVAAFERLFINQPTKLRHGILTILKGNNGRGEGAAAWMRANLHLLRGKNLACWCELPAPGKPDHCHAAALLRFANPVCDSLPTPSTEAPGSTGGAA